MTRGERRKKLEKELEEHKLQLEKDGDLILNDVYDQVKDILIIAGAGLGAWAIGSVFGSALGGKKGGKGSSRFGKAMGSILTPLAAKVVSDLLKKPLTENGAVKEKEEVNGVKAD